jgi:hypothetical protein
VTFERWIDRPGRDVRARVLTRPYEFASPFGGEPFALLLVLCDPTITNAERDSLCEAIVASACRHVLCSGPDCETWHDVIDETIVGPNPDLDAPISELMTSWQLNRWTLADAVGIVFDYRISGVGECERYLVAFVGDDSSVRAQYETLVRQRSSGGGAQ